MKCDVAKLHSVASNSTAVPCMAFVKVYNAPLQSQRPIEGQLQALTLSLGGGSNGEDGVRSYFTQLQQLTRHLYAPVVRAAGQTIEVSTAKYYLWPILGRSVRCFTICFYLSQQNYEGAQYRLQHCDNSCLHRNTDFY